MLWPAMTYNENYREVLIRGQGEKTTQNPEEEEETDQDDQHPKQEWLFAGTAIYQVTHKPSVAREREGGAWEDGPKMVHSMRIPDTEGVSPSETEPLGGIHHQDLN